MKPLKTTLILLLVLFTTLQYSKVNGQNTLSKEEKKEGWKLLFDGRTTNKWKGYNLDSVTPNWSIENNILIADGTVGDIITKKQFKDFDLKLDWKIAIGGNSGLFYHIKEGSYDMMWRTGIEMQILDNVNTENGKNPIRNAGSLYELYAPIIDATKPAGEWNKSRIIVEKGNVQYWLNGKKILDYKLWSSNWYADREKSIHNKTRKPDWGEFKKGHIGLQDEGFKVEFRNIKIKKL